MCWYAHSSSDGLLIRTALKKLLAVHWVCEKQSVIADRLHSVGVFFLFCVAFETFTL